jgi:hypothetical protein
MEEEEKRRRKDAEIAKVQRRKAEKKWNPSAPRR